jgi:hypothetical protein
MRKETLVIAMCMTIAFGMALMGQSVAEQLSPLMKEIAVRMESLKRALIRSPLSMLRTTPKGFNRSLFARQAFSGQMARSRWPIQPEQMLV